MSFTTAYNCNQIVIDDDIKSGIIVVDSQGKISDIITDVEQCVQISKHENVIKIERGVVMAGIVDSHVHVNSPGRSEWEDFPCVTRAAAFAGVTTIADMPLNSIPSTTTLENLKIKADVARDTVYVDVAFWGGVVPNNEAELLGMIDAGVVGFKCFLCPSGVDEFPNVTESDLEKALKVLENTDSVLAFHAECELDKPQEDTNQCDEEYAKYLSTRPASMELKALELISKMADKYKARYHIVHISAVQGVSIVEKMKQKGVRITAETCPHYLTLKSECVPRAATQFKCAPPVRNEHNREELWECVKNGAIDMVVSDHSPCTPALKTSNFLKAWGGISSVQFGLPLIWTEASKQGIGLPVVSRLMSAAPANLCRLNSKGALKPGFDADFIVLDPEEKFVVTKEIILHKNKLTPYLGMELKGKVLQTYIRGQLVFNQGCFTDKPLGKLLLNKLP